MTPADPSAHLIAALICLFAAAHLAGDLVLEVWRAARTNRRSAMDSTRLRFTCHGCDERREAELDTVVIVQSGGDVAAPRAVVATCPECSAVHVDPRPAAVALAGPFVTWVRLDHALPARVRTRLPLTEAEVQSFADRLALTPDGRDGASPPRPGQTLMLNIAWTELGLSAADPGATS